MTYSDLPPRAMISDDVLHFQHYTFKHRMISWVSRTLFDRFTYTARHGLINGMKRKGGLGWLPQQLSGALTAEEKFWLGMDLSGLTVYDVGAFEGLLTMFFARTARQVVCYEPNARNRGRLIENLELNRIENVVMRPVGLGDTPLELQMIWDPSMPGGASVESAIVENLRNTVSRAKSQSIPVTTLDLDRTQLGLPAPDLIKIDIEGWELQALRGARETIAAHKPALYLEMHGETMQEKKRKVAGIVEFLKDAGYGAVQHVESGQEITPQNSAVACEGHLFCAAPADIRVTAPLAKR